MGQPDRFSLQAYVRALQKKSGTNKVLKLGLQARRSSTWSNNREFNTTHQKLVQGSMKRNPYQCVRTRETTLNLSGFLAYSFPSSCMHVRVRVCFPFYFSMVKTSGIDVRKPNRLDSCRVLHVAFSGQEHHCIYRHRVNSLWRTLLFSFPDVNSVFCFLFHFLFGRKTIKIYLPHAVVAGGTKERLRRVPVTSVVGTPAC
jgi:hypothetical protein